MGAVQRWHQVQGRLQQHGGVVAGQGKVHPGGPAEEVRRECAGAGEHREPAGPLPLPPQLLRRPHDVAGHRLAQLLQFADRPTEAAADAGFPFGGGGLLQRQAAHSPQLQLQPQPHHPGLGPQLTAGHVAQLAGIGDAAQPAPAAEPSTHTPELFRRCALQPGVGILLAAQVEQTGVLAVGLGDAVGQLGQHLAGGDADGDRQPQVAADAAAQLARPWTEVAAGGARQPGEGLIDRVHLQLCYVGLQAAHQPLAHVAVEGVVGASHHHAVAGQLLGDLEVGPAHGDAQLAGLAAARHHAAVVVGEHHHRPPQQCRIDCLLAAGIEVVGVDQHQGISHGG